jgi:hypothetical protein
MRLRKRLNGQVTMIGPGRLIDFPGAALLKQLAKSAQQSDSCPDHSKWPKGETLHMKTFHIDRNHHIALLTGSRDAPTTEPNACFTSATELAELVREWPGSRLVDTWNALPGVQRVRKFTDRQVAVRRIWGAIQKLAPTEEETVVRSRTPKKTAPIQTKRTEPVPADATSKKRAGRSTASGDFSAEW